MVIKQQLQVSNLATSLGRSQAGKRCDRLYRITQYTRSDRGHSLFLATTFVSTK